MKKIIIISILIIIVLIQSVVAAQELFDNDSQDEMETLRGEVLEVETSSSDVGFEVQIVTLKIYSGTLDGNVEVVKKPSQ